MFGHDLSPLMFSRHGIKAARDPLATLSTSLFNEDDQSVNGA
jgi:hypothetical protein